DKLDVLARAADGTPLLIDHRLGAGRVLVLNTTANDEWTDLPRRRSFVPLLDGMLSYLSGGNTRRTFSAGDSVLLPLPEEPGAAKLTIAAPGGEKLDVAVQRHGGRSFAALNQANEPGRYTLERGGEAWLTFAVNAPRGSSPLAAMDEKMLAAWWAPAATEIL